MEAELLEQLPVIELRENLVQVIEAFRALALQP